MICFWDDVFHVVGTLHLEYPFIVSKHGEKLDNDKSKLSLVACSVGRLALGENPDEGGVPKTDQNGPTKPW